MAEQDVDQQGEDDEPDLPVRQKVGIVMVALGEEVLDLGREVEGEVGEPLVHRLDDPSGVGGPVEEVGIGEGDVLRAGFDEAGDVVEHDLFGFRQLIAQFGQRMDAPAQIHGLALPRLGLGH